MEDIKIENNIEEKDLQEIKEVKVEKCETIYKSTSKSNVYSKLQEARVLLQEGGLKKSGNNAGRYNFFELEDFLPPINAIFHKLKLFSVTNTNSERGQITIINTEDVEDRLTITIPSCEVELKGGGIQMQGIGAQQTYMKRYLYMSALEISEVDIIDNQPQSENKGKANKSDKENGSKQVAETVDSVKAEVIEKCRELSEGGKRDIVNETVKKYHITPNPSGMKDIKKLKQLREELNKL